jgi:hypothetical protein
MDGLRFEYLKEEIGEQKWSFVFSATEERSPNAEHHHENNKEMEGMTTRLTNKNCSTRALKGEGTTTM